MKIVVFGGGGFIGSAIVDRLLQEEHQIVVFEHARVQPYRAFLPTEQVRWHSGDFLSVYDVGEAIRGAEIVVHLVYTTLPKSSNDDPIYDVQSNIVGTLQLLNSMVEHNVSRIIFISSGGAVYGNSVPQLIDENHPTDPLVSYGVTKLAIEKYLLIYERLRGIRPVILRVANPYGKRQRIETAQGVVGAFIHHAMHGQPIEIWGDGSVTRDFIYVEDVAEAFAQAIHYHGTERIFNIGSGKGVSVNDLIEILERILRCSVNKVYKEARAFDVQVSVLSNERARLHLGWMPRIGLYEGITRTIAWSNQQQLDLTRK